jgi:hypothetical protein
LYLVFLAIRQALSGGDGIVLNVPNAHYGVSI